MNRTGPYCKAASSLNWWRGESVCCKNNRQFDRVNNTMTVTVKTPLHWLLPLSRGCGILRAGPLEKWTHMIVYLNGKYVDATQARISVWDGGYLYGDGIYTTLRLYRGRPADLAAHYERLQNQAAELNLPLTLSPTDFREIAVHLAEVNDLTDEDGRLRITLSRGGSFENPLPLENLQQIPPTVLFTLAPLPAELENWRAQGIAAVTLDAAFARGNFPTLKSLNSLATLRALRQAAAAGCQEAILTDATGGLLEGAISNLFLVAGDHLLTPACGGNFLAGRTREHILAIAGREGIEVREKALDRRHLEAACEVFMASSVREVLPVISIDGVPVGDGKPGDFTRRLQALYRCEVTGAG
jgi:branched-subunit amino acid aminotransferase/4-amino-4-deoxychorismate lyase